MNTRFFLIAALYTATISAVHAEGDAVKGRDVFSTRCIACHAIACNRIGPKLEGVIGRTAASLEDFDGYTDELKAAGLVWSEQTLDQFLADPSAMVPGTAMWVGKVDDPVERRNVIAFVQSGDTSLDFCS